MKKADKPIVVQIHILCNNKVSQSGKDSLPSVNAIFLIALAVLTVSLSCPDLLADFIRWIVGIAISN